MNISEPLEKIENSLGVMFHFGVGDDGMTMAEARHLVGMLQVDIAGHVEAIRYEDEHADDMDEEARKARAELDKATEQIRLLKGRIDSALQSLAVAGDEAIKANVRCEDREITEHIGMSAIRIGAAMRALRGQDEMVEYRLGQK